MIMILRDIDRKSNWREYQFGKELRREIVGWRERVGEVIKIGKSKWGGYKNGDE